MLQTVENHVAAVSSVTKTNPTKISSTKDGKKSAALMLFEANTDKGNGEIARLIAKELEITYANAYYYVTRVFKR